ncbi:hypothetical protein GH714_043300 [Hevea brasiliensis]|uniref:Trichome birefringence-like C-terminal domain-containing protein n=1 Tax=Hevea brasiliensis TaxID=3981 RepID=A0A6A6K2W7_HEVBR|nr:hypothetical protein GH714_043300 [Hevea brasiliensis]
MRGKRIVFVGDSLSRTQWESLICMLMTGVEDKRSVYEVNGNKITKQIRFLGVRFSSFDLRIDFYRSVFLVQPGPTPRRAPKRVKSILKLDKLDDISNEWIDSDVLIFNSGHWWTPSKLFEMGCYFQIGASLKLGMPITTAFKTALNTWVSWAETTINANKTSLFFRTFESSHWSGRNRLSCKVTRRPSSKTGGKDWSSVSDIIIRAVKKMSVPVTVLHVTPMGAFRSDAHVVVVFVSLGGLFFLAFLAVALCCFLKKKKKKEVKETDLIHVDEHKKAKEAIVEGPHGPKVVILDIEDDVHVDEVIKKEEKLGKGLHAKSVEGSALQEGAPSSSSNHPQLEHKA